MESYAVTVYETASPMETILGLVFSFAPLLILMVVVAVVFVIIALVLKAASRREPEKSAELPVMDAEPVPAPLPVHEEMAMVITKRTQNDGTYHVGFELPDGRRMELNVTGVQYGVILEGDQGLVRWQGIRMINFTRSPAEKTGI